MKQTRPQSLAEAVTKTWRAFVVLTALLAPGAIVGQVSVATLLTNGDLRISHTGIPGYSYVIEWTDSLTSPVAWTPLLANTSDGNGLVTFTDTPAASPTFYRIRPGSLPLPLVYPVEHTGTNCAPPPLPSLVSLPFIQPLTDPFEWSNRSGRSTNFTDWKCRRAEIKAEIENYEIGTKPAVDLANVFASYAAGVLTVRVTNVVSGTNQVLTLACTVVLPAGTGPFPAVIGMNSGSGSLPSTLFSSRNIARITFSHNQVTTYNNPQNTDPYYRLYPNLNVDNTGQYSAWAWGVSRIIDGLQKVQDTLPIDLKHLAITGCSYAGKMALFAGALDERVALTIAQESGGGGAAAWRVSETLGEVEKLGATSHQWFKESMFQFSGSSVSRLPMDHHELMAMVAPRALLVFGNPDYTWLADESGFVSCKAAHEVWKTFGVPDRFGFDIVGGHVHCTPAASQTAAAVAFVEKFLLGNTNANTVITNAPTYANTDHTRWYQWWGSGNPAFPPTGTTYTQMFEPECATVGTNWNILTDALASNEKYVMVTPGVQSIASAPANSWDWITIPLTLTNSGTYAVFARVNGPTADDDSFWVKMNSSTWVQRNGLTTSGWQWQFLNSYSLAAGPHTLYIGYREDGARLDKISVSTYPFAPTGMGQPAENNCP